MHLHKEAFVFSLFLLLMVVDHDGNHRKILKSLKGNTLAQEKAEFGGDKIINKAET